MDDETRVRIVATWSARDAERAIHPSDHRAIEGTASIRALVLERIDAVDQRDLFHACAVLGRMIATHGGSPTLAASTLDGAREALAAADVPWLLPARAALIEGFAAARAELVRADAAKLWDAPHCTVRVDATTIAIAAGHPDDDIDALTAWSARVAKFCVREGYRRTLLGGNEAACAALRDALAIAGVEVASPHERRGFLGLFR